MKKEVYTSVNGQLMAGVIVGAHQKSLDRAGNYRLITITHFKVTKCMDIDNPTINKVGSIVKLRYFKELPLDNLAKFLNYTGSHEAEWDRSKKRLIKNILKEREV